MAVLPAAREVSSVVISDGKVIGTVVSRRLTHPAQVVFGIVGEVNCYRTRASAIAALIKKEGAHHA